MSLFSKRKDLEVQSFVLKLVNNTSAKSRAKVEGPRLGSRVNLVVVVLVIPIEADRPRIAEAFTAISKEFSNTGVALVLDKPYELEKVVLGFRVQGRMTFARAQARHLHPMGGGFYQLGFQMLDIVSPSDYSELEVLDFT
jgi:hypothetical protein